LTIAAELLRPTYNTEAIQTPKQTHDIGWPNILVKNSCSQITLQIRFSRQFIDVLRIDTISDLTRCVVLHVNLVNLAIPSKRVVDLAQLDAFESRQKLGADRTWLFGVGRDVGRCFGTGFAGYRSDRYKSCSCACCHDLVEARELFIFDLREVVSLRILKGL
jgi:hypothetical protein